MSVQPSLVQAMMQRELGAVRRTVAAYPDDLSVWSERPGLPNSGGTLVLHIAGNIQHYLGTVLGRSGYRRDREAEFSRRGVPRSALLAEIDAAQAAVDLGFRQLTAAALLQPFPELIGGRRFITGDYLVHLASHLAYHLGQLDYHRRAVTGDQRSIGALAPGELPERGPGSTD